MRKNYLLAFLIFTILVAEVFPETVKYDILKKSYKIGTVITLFNIDDSSTASKAVVEKKPFLSESFPVIKENIVSFTPDCAGKYEIKVNSDSEIIRFSIEVDQNSQLKSEEIVKLINTRKDEGNFKEVIEKCELLKQNYPDSKYFPDMLYIAGESAEKAGEQEKAGKYYEKIVKNFKLSEEASERVLYKLFKSIEGKKELAEDRYFYGKKLYNSNPEKYGAEFAKFCIESGIFLQEGIEIAEKSYIETGEKELAEILGDYYYGINSPKAVLYYKNVDKRKLSLAYLKLNDYNKFNESLKQLGESDRRDMLKAEEAKKAKERAQGYLDRIEEAQQQQKYEIADLFINKINSEIKDPEIIKKAVLQKGENEFLKKNYKETITVLKKYENSYKIVKEADVYYYIAMAYFNSSDIKNSYIYFDKITREFPGSSWDSKAKIYKIKIKK